MALLAGRFALAFASPDLRPILARLPRRRLCEPPPSLESTGFIVACCLVRPEGVSTLTPKSVKKKLKDKAFAVKVERHEVRTGCEILGVEIGEHIQFIIEALKPHAAELGIEGRGAG